MRPLSSKRATMRLSSLFWLTLILLLSALLRITGLGDQPLWIDEAYSYIAIKSPDLIAALTRDVHPPLYFLLLEGWSVLAGISEFSLRYPSVLLGVLSTALMFQMAREIVILRGEPKNRVVPILAALMLGISEMGFYVSQEVRSYSLHITLGILSMWAFLRWCRLSGRLGGVIWVLSTAAVVYTHYLGAWVGVVQFGYALLFLRGRKRLAAAGHLTLAAALFAIWLFAVVLPYQTIKADSDATMDASTLQTLFSYAKAYLTEQWSLMLGLFLIGLVHIDSGNRIRLRSFNASVLLILWIMIPVLLTFIGNLRFSILTSYRISQIMIPLALIWAAGLAAFRLPARAFLIGVVILYSIVAVDFSRTVFPWDNYARMTSDFAQSGDLVVMDFKGVDFSMEYYLDRQLPSDIKTVSLRNYTLWEPNRLYDTLIPKLQHPETKTVWLPRWNDQPTAFDLLTANGFIQTMRRELNYQGITVETYRFDRLEDASPLAIYENGMILRQGKINPTHMDLWWSIEAPTDRDFTVSAFLLDGKGQLIAQHDSQPMLNERPTSTWNPEETVYDPKPFGEIPTGVYQVGVKVYRWRPDGVRDIPLEDGQPYAVIGEIQVESAGS
jgi:hypothetical protein